MGANGGGVRRGRAALFLRGQKWGCRQKKNSWRTCRLKCANGTTLLFLRATRRDGKNRASVSVSSPASPILPPVIAQGLLRLHFADVPKKARCITASSVDRKSVV